MKKRAGLATDAELRVLGSAWRFLGGSEPGSGVLGLPAPCETTEDWVARYGGPQDHLPAIPDVWAVRRGFTRG